MGGPGSSVQEKHKWILGFLKMHSSKIRQHDYRSKRGTYARGPANGIACMGEQNGELCHRSAMEEESYAKQACMIRAGTGTSHELRLKPRSYAALASVQSHGSESN